MKDRKIFTLQVTRTDKKSKMPPQKRRSSVPTLNWNDKIFSSSADRESMEPELRLPPMKAFQSRLQKMAVEVTCKGFAESSEGSPDLWIEKEHKETYVWWQRQEVEKETVLTPNSNVELDGFSDSILLLQNNDKNTSEMKLSPLRDSPSFTGSLGSIDSLNERHKKEKMEEGKMTSPKR